MVDFLPDSRVKQAVRCARVLSTEPIGGWGRLNILNGCHPPMRSRGEAWSCPSVMSRTSRPQVVPADEGEHNDKDEEDGECGFLPLHGLPVLEGQVKSSAGPPVRNRPFEVVALRAVFEV